MQPTVPVFAAFMSILLKRESMTVMKLAGISCAIVGTICIVVGETYLVPQVADTGEEDASPLTSGGESATDNTTDSTITPSSRLLGIG